DGQCENFHPGRPRRLSTNQPPTLDYTLNCEEPDNAAEHTIEAAKQKAYTAAAFGAPTSELAKRINGTGPSIADLPGTLFLAGGVPLKVNGVSVAGIGVGGAPDGALDEACATAGADAVAGTAK
ncbi:heme-binding protein, partial [Pseudarthrobacter oxydans]|uniref:GlcG/HbpS family heme-binding protein n=1 Tax=Pseudarthrobacter oxydans TaxID=1671 RepID=UPI00381259B3